MHRYSFHVRVPRTRMMSNMRVWWSAKLEENNGNHLVTFKCGKQPKCFKRCIQSILHAKPWQPLTASQDMRRQELITMLSSDGGACLIGKKVCTRFWSIALDTVMTLKFKSAKVGLVVGFSQQPISANSSVTTLLCKALSKILRSAALSLLHGAWQIYLVAVCLRDVSCIFYTLPKLRYLPVSSLSTKSLLTTSQLQNLISWMYGNRMTVPWKTRWPVAFCDVRFVLSLMQR